MYRKSRKMLAVCLVVTMLLTMTAFSSIAAAATSSRLQGGDRYATALDIAKTGWTTSEFAVLATGEDFADALSAAPLAKAYDAPILLVKPGEDNPALKSELTALGVKTVFIVGGEGVVSKSFADSLGLTVNRLGGSNRVETSVKVAEQLVAKYGTISEVVVANLEAYADALAIAPIAANHKAPILLTEKDSLPSAVSAFLAGKTITKSYVVGETGVVSDTVKAALPNAVRLGGADRYATNAAILSYFKDLSYANVFTTTGEDYPDALAGSAYAAKLNAPIVLAYNGITADLLNLVKTNATPSTKVIALGGAAVLPEYAVASLNDAINASSPYAYILDVTTRTTQIEADGAANTTVTVALLNKGDGTVDENADDVVVALSTTWGKLDHDRVTLQDGIGEVTLTSEYSQTARDAKISATLIEADAESYRDLIGKLSDNATVKMMPGTELAGDTPILIGAESNEANSVTLYFDQTVTVKDFVKYDSSTGKYVVDSNGNAVLKDNVWVGISQRGFKWYENDKQIRGFKLVAGNSNAIEVILGTDEWLVDNQKVFVTVAMPDSKGVIVTQSWDDFILTDSRVPEATNANNDGMKTVIVKFSEPVKDLKDVSLDAGLIPVASYSFGTFNAATLADSRNILTINVGKDYHGNQVYMTAGEHSVQVSAVRDYAGMTDDNNISSTQTIDFVVEENTSRPSATVKVESPEQFRITFNKDVTATFAPADDMTLMVWDAAEEEYVKVPRVAYTVTLYKNNEYVVELDKDWTVYYDTDTTKENYYNDKYQLFIPKGAVTNPENGLKNDKDIKLDLNYSGSPLNTPDVTSPTIDKFEATGEVDHYYVTMSEPVKLPGKDIADTVAQLQNKVPTPIVEFIGKDENGKIVTVPGCVVGYASAKDNGADKVIEVAPALRNATDPYELQWLVDRGYGEDWTLVVRSISDDIGNTAASLTYKFTIKPTPDNTVFEVDEAHTISGHAVFGFKYDFGRTEFDAVMVKYTDAVKVTGSAQNAANVANYQIDGLKLPDGSFIRVLDSDMHSWNGNDRKLILIVMPEGTLDNMGNGRDIHVLNIGKNLVSANGHNFQGENEFEFTTAGDRWVHSDVELLTIEE